MTNFPKGPVVVLLPPGTEVTDRSALQHEYPGLTIIRQQVTEALGCCAVISCPGKVRRVSLPVLVDPNADLKNRRQNASSSTSLLGLWLRVHSIADL